MNTNLSEKFKSPEDARLWAQIISFGPILFQLARSLRNLGILKFLAENQVPEGPSFQEILQSVDISEYGLGVLLDAAESCGLVTNVGGNFSLTEAGNNIATDRLTEVNMNFTNEVCYKGFEFLEESVRSGRPAGLKVFGDWQTIYEGLTQLPPKALKSWLEFDHYFSDDAYPKILPIVFHEPVKRVLEVGCNTGKFALAATKYRSDFELTLIDHPEQLALAKEKLDAEGVGHRITALPIDVLNHAVEFPTGQDVIWMSQFLDCFKKEDIRQIMKRAAAAMTDDGTFFILETFTDRQRYAPARLCVDMTSLYFTCMANGNSRMYRAREFYELLGSVGLQVVEEKNNIRLSHTLLKIKKVKS